jgi:hypothetical protein
MLEHMMVLTVDQIDSRHRADRVDAAIRELAARHARLLAASPERTAGDEFQLATRDAETALAVALDLVRAGDWSVGLGIGDLDTPVGPSVRAMSGSAFVHAREAVTAAKKRPARFALVAGPPDGAHLDPLVRLLLSARERRTAEGWELADLLETEPGLTLTEAGARLGISPQAASQRAQTAGIRLDQEARAAITALLAELDARIGG